MEAVEAIYEEFAPALDARWQRHVVGSGALEPSGSSLCFTITGATHCRYSNAQIDDYQGLPRRRFLWRPPLRLMVRARFSHPASDGLTGLRGTAGFGFWNDPFLMTGARLPALPRAIWFFYASPPSNIKLDLAAPGYGWKATTIDAQQPAVLALGLFAPWAAILMNVPRIYHAFWPPIQRALSVRETTIGVGLTDWHTYVLEWGIERAQFFLDESATPFLDAPSPRGPLGFVLWLDNQYMVVTPWGRVGWGLLDVESRQWLEVDRLSIEPGSRDRTGVCRGNTLWR